MKLPFKEPSAPRYIYINPVTNTVHLLMPIMSGTDIGLDNTCQSVSSLREFFGVLDANRHSAAVRVLMDYKDALVFDLNYMPVSEEKSGKAYRLSQIDIYLDILRQVRNDTQIRSPLLKPFPLYPEPLVTLMQADDANLHSIILRPKQQDNYLRMTAIEPTFSANHNQVVNGQVVTQASVLDDSLRQDLTLPTKSQEELLIARLLANHPGLPVKFDAIKDALIDEINTYLGMTVNFEFTQGTRYAGSVPMTEAYIHKQLGIDADNPATTEEYVNGLIQYCTPNLFDNVDVSPFYTVNNSERLSILTQFFLAELNIACREQRITGANFGQILESDVRLFQDFAKTLEEALKQSAQVEESLIQYINQHQQRFKLTELISEESVQALKKRFKSHWEHIKESPHFDEFMLLGEKKGLFVTHQGCIATHFANVILIGWNDHRLDAALQDFSRVDKPDNVIPHKNEFIHAQEIDIDLSQMDEERLHALYDEINTDPDQTLKRTLLAQFKAERPDFKPKIDAKKFLQHVAYGEQNEAEALLQQDPESAQTLLMAYDIPFTDYSGRTFNCTAYEYAYWAKDTHMQRMLEKYIRVNEETRLLILQRVQDIEKPVVPAAALSLFFQPLSKPNGLHYTTEDHQGQTINHQDVGFDLTPLINALKHYTDEYKKTKTDPDWQVLDRIWIEEVGRAQREVPAHIAHEYCHPDRDFDEINKNNELLNASNPDNLTRLLRFYNYDTGTYDVWFSPGSYSEDSGLGFSFGISRPMVAALVRVCWSWRRSPEWLRAGSSDDEQRALTTIDNVRTSDRKQSLLNLSQPMHPNVSPSMGNS